MISPLADPTFKRLFIAQVVALAGTGLASIALALLAYDLAGGNAGVVLGTALALKMVAYVGVAPLAGAFANRLPRKTLLIGLDVSRAIIVLGIPFVTEIWQIYLLIFLLNACSAGFTPTFQATIPDLLPDDARYTRALSLSRLAYDLENLLSPLLAAAALTVLSYNALFITNAATFLLSALLVSTVVLPSPRSLERATGGTDNLTFGIRAYLATPRLRGLLALSLAVASAGSMVIVNTVVYVRDQLGGTESETAIAFATFGAGSMIVALALPKFLDKLPDRPFMLGGGVLLAAAMFSGAFEPGWPGLLAIWLALGLGSSLVQTPAGRLLKRSASEGDRTAVYAAQFALSHGCWLLAYPVAGFIGSAFGLRAAFLILGFAALAATVVARSRWPDDQVDVAHAHAPLQHEHRHRHDEHHQHDHEGWEGPEPHQHAHNHAAVKHKHTYVIDLHHPVWPD